MLVSMEVRDCIYACIYLPGLFINVNNTILYKNMAKKGGGVNIESTNALRMLLQNSWLFVKSMQYRIFTATNEFVCAMILQYLTTMIQEYML